MRITKLVIHQKNNEPIRYDKRVECKKTAIRENAITFSPVQYIPSMKLCFRKTFLAI